MHSPWDRTRFRRLLQRIMKDTGLSQQQVADAARISRSQVSRWQSGAHRPNFDALRRLATVLHRDYPDSADLGDALMAAAGYPEGIQPSTGGKGAHSVGGLTEEEAAQVRAFIEGLRTAAAKRAAPKRPRPAREPRE